MNISTVKQVLPILLRNNIVPFLWGSQGIGKTEVVKQYAAENNLGFVHLHLATQEVGDLVGLLRFREDGAVEHSRPEWFPTEGKGIIFLDELNRAHPDVIQAMFSFITHGSIHRHQKPSDWKIVAAGNYASDDFQVTDTSDAAWLSRFCHIDVKPSAADFASYAKQKGEELISEFALEHLELFEPSNKKGIELNLTVNNRAMMSGIAKLEKENLDEATRMEVYSGIIGVRGAAAFLSFKQGSGKRVRISHILQNYSEVRDKLIPSSEQREAKLDLLNAPIEELERELVDKPDMINDDNYENLVSFLLDLPVELMLSALTRIKKLEFNARTKLMNDNRLTERLL